MAEVPETSLTVIVPVYQEAATVEEALRRVLGVELENIVIDVVVVESNSSDGTREKVLAMAANPRLQVLLQEEARGKGHAVRQALQHARGEIVLIQDADLEYEVSDYEKLIAPILDGRSSFVLGSRHDASKPMRDMDNVRFMDGFMNVGHVACTKYFNLLYRVRLHDPFTMYKVFRRNCVRDIRFECNRFDFDWELVGKLIRLGYAPLEVPVQYKSRSFDEGKKIRLIRDPLTWFWAGLKYRCQPKSHFVEVHAPKSAAPETPR
jgi:glycosyltransferase involved in cell wall biosynthesis